MSLTVKQYVMESLTFRSWKRSKSIAKSFQNQKKAYCVVNGVYGMPRCACCYNHVTNIFSPHVKSSNSKLRFLYTIFQEQANPTNPAFCNKLDLPFYNYRAWCRLLDMNAVQYPQKSAAVFEVQVFPSVCVCVGGQYNVSSRPHNETSYDSFEKRFI